LAFWGLPKIAVAEWSSNFISSGAGAPNNGKRLTGKELAGRDNCAYGRQSFIFEKLCSGSDGEAGFGRAQENRNPQAEGQLAWAHESAQIGG
jgi:hypothetical protein